MPLVSIMYLTAVAQVGILAIFLQQILILVLRCLQHSLFLHFIILVPLTRGRVLVQCRLILLMEHMVNSLVVLRCRQDFLKVTPFLVVVTTFYQVLLGFFQAEGANRTIVLRRNLDYGHFLLS